MIRVFASTELFRTYRTLKHHLWTFSFDVLSQLWPRQMLILFHVTNITAKLGTLIIADMILKFIDCHPEDFWARISLNASVREFTEFDDITDNWIHLNEDFLRHFLLSKSTRRWSSGRIYSWRRSWSLLAFSLILLITLWCTISKLYLAIFAVYFVGIFVFKWHVWESTAHITLDLLNQFPLELVLDFILFNINLGDRIRSHKLIHHSIWKHEVELIWLRVLFVFLWTLFLIFWLALNVKWRRTSF